MSLAGLQNSWSNAGASSSGALSVSSLTVNNVPVTGLGSSGVPLTSQSPATSVATVPTGIVLTTVSNLILQENDATAITQIDDQIDPDPVTGNWTYVWPVPFSSAPIVETKANVGSADPIVTANSATLLAGQGRFQRDDVKVVIRAIGKTNPRLDIKKLTLIPAGPLLSPVPTTGYASVPYVLAPPPAVSSTNPLRWQVPVTLVTPADLLPQFACQLVASWASPRLYTQSEGTVITSIYFSTVASLPKSQGTLVGSWPAIATPSGFFGRPTPTEFASTASNQYQTFSVLLQPSTTYYIYLDFLSTDGQGFSVPRSPLQIKADFQSFSYYANAV